MDFEPGRLRKGEMVAGAGGLALLVFLFALPWLSSGPAHATTSSGWSGLPVLRWVIIVTAVAALALAFTQGTRSAPAIPVILSVYVPVLGALCTVLLILRLLTTGDGLRVGAFLGPLSSIAILVGGFLSLRQEGGWTPAPEHPVKTISLRAGDRA